MNLITHTKTKRHKIKLKLEEGLTSVSELCVQYIQSSITYELFPFIFYK